MAQDLVNGVLNETWTYSWQQKNKLETYMYVRTK